MSEPRLISPMLDNYIMGQPISNHHGVACCPAIENGTEERYIVKVISVPASSSQLDALLLSGAYPDTESALTYFKGIADGVMQEVDILSSLAELEGFLPFANYQMETSPDGNGYEIYLLSSYKRTLQKHFKRHIFTHLDALNLGLDLCAALAVSRRSGYLYVDLKPSNVFVTDQRLFRIGDLGFLRLDSLKYASLPEKYQSEYTPPEIRDAFSALNTTMDTYAAGLILYQAYNNGELPFNDEVRPGDALPAPLYADYEMSEIILKACAPNPEDRWEDPMQMGQAIINYMQRNGAQDIPIVPMPAAEDTPAEEIEEITEEILEVESEAEVTDETASEIPEEQAEDTADAVEITEEQAEDIVDSDTEDSAESLSFLIESEDDIDEEEIQDEQTDYTALTEEASEMLEQADELAALDVPEPVVVPEHIDLPMPEPAEPEEAEEIEPTADETDNEAAENDEINDAEEDAEVSPVHIKMPAHLVRNLVIILVSLLLIVGCFFFYKDYYILPIEAIKVEGSEDSLTVYVTTDIDESLLRVICSDTYGNQIPAPVIDGKAVFDDLVPNTAYSIKVVSSGFHRLTGNATTAYSTPIQTNIAQFDAVTGSADGSVILSFAIEGPDCNEWTVEYVAEGEEKRTATFASHMVTLTDLTIGKEYTFRLIPRDALYVTGQNEITFTPRTLVRAENLRVTECVNSTLTVQWDTPAGQSVSGWSVHCSGDNYSQTIITTENTATFQGLDHTKAFDIEVKAVGMSVSQTVSIPANSITAMNFAVDTSNPNRFAFSWEPSQPITDAGWTMCYTVAGLDAVNSITCNQNSAVIDSLIPNATYRVWLQDANKNPLLGSQVVLTTPAAQDFAQQFNGFFAKREYLTFLMCKTPSKSYWTHNDLSSEDYTSEFAVNQKASFVVKYTDSRQYTVTQEEVATMYVIRKEDGTLVSSTVKTDTWYNMWYKKRCELDIPSLPAEVGTYSIEVYFNGGLAHTQSFTVK